MNEKPIRIERRVDALRDRETAADVAEDRSAFVDAVTAELRNWEVYLERLQVRAAAKDGETRELAEAMITRLRGRRNAVSQRLGEVGSASAEVWHEGRERVQAAREELERSAAETHAWFDGGGTA